MRAALRLTGSLLAALGVVGVLLICGARLHGALSSPAGSDGAFRPVAVDGWPEGVRRPGEAGVPGGREAPPLPSLPPVDGHVQLDVRVDETGRVIAATVVDATVPPSLGELAREDVLQRRYAPGPARFSETVAFDAPD